MFLNFGRVSYVIPAEGRWLGGGDIYANDCGSKKFKRSQGFKRFQRLAPWGGRVQKFKVQKFKVGSGRRLPKSLANFFPCSSFRWRLADGRWRGGKVDG